ncbi:MAG TPA: glycerate kinase [Candidatus Acidoferrales bacterium]|nr:glycerate kinase [Candidatus Acidoferrales bacterium]
MVAIRNKEQLVKNGKTTLDRRARELALGSLEAALNAVDPKKIIESKVVLKDCTLKVDDYSFDVREFKNIYVIGGGKASGSMAEALEQVLDSRITDGLVNVLHENRNETRIIKLHGANHPVPDEAGVEGTRRMLEIAEGATADDLIVCLISGGGSSLMPLPRGDITLADKRQVTDALLKSGATINEVNTVRKHISDFKGGWLAKKAYPATILNLILSDVIGDPLDFIASGPTVPDSTTFSEAIGVLKKYDLWANAPSSIRKLLLDGEKGLVPETPKAGDEAFKKVYSFVLGNNRFATQAACEGLKSAGLNTLMLTAMMEGEARQVGIVLASIAREASVSGNPVPKPAGMVAGGETTVFVVGKGMGGRNQEIALAAAIKLEGLDGVAVASLSTDGVDGPTDAAGAVIDGQSLARAREVGLAPEKFLAENDSYHFFSKLGDLIFTGPTGTNVNDVSVIVIL